MAIFRPKPWVHPFGKMSIFRLFELVVFKAQNGLFLFQNIVKDIFPAYIAKKEKLDKMAIFGPKPLVNPFGEMSIFRLFELFVFVAQKGVLFVLEYRKRHFPGLHCLKQKLEKWPFLHQNHGLTPFEKWQVFDFLKFLYLQTRKAFFRSRIS